MKLTEQVTFRTTVEIKGYVEKLAKESNKKASQVINELLTKAMGIDKDTQAHIDIESIREIVIKQERRIKQLEASQQEIVKKLAA